MSSSIHHGPQVLFDTTVVAGVISPARVSEAFLIPDLSTATVVHYHSGWGAGAIGAYDVSADGVTWIAGGAMALTATVPTALSTTPSTGGNHRFVRARISNGGANGGRVIVLLIRREQR